MSKPPLPPPPSSPLVTKNTVPTNLVRNRIELLQTAEAVFRKYGELIPLMNEYLNQILYLARNIDRFLMDLDPPEQAIWSSKHKNLFDPIFPALKPYEQFLPIVIKIMVLDQTTLYTHDLLMHLMVLLIGEDLTRRGAYSDRAVEQMGQTFMYLLDIVREFFRRRNVCLDVLSSSLTMDARLLEASKYRGTITFLIQFLAVDEMNAEDTWRALYILSRQEHHVANLLKASAEHQFENGHTAEIKEQAKKDAIKYFEIAKRLGDFLKTLTEEITENATVRKLEAERSELSAKAKKNAANAAKAEANRAAREAEAELLREEEEAAAAAAGKAEKEKKKREEKAARKAAEKAEADRIAAEKAAATAAAAAAEKAEANRVAAEKKVAKNAVKKSANLLAASMKQRAPELMTPVRTPLLKKPSASPPAPPAPSPASLPSSASPTSSNSSPPLPPPPPPSPFIPSASPPTLTAMRPVTPSLTLPGFTPYSRSPPVIRFWETLDHRYIYQLLYDLFIRTDNSDARFYLKGSAAIHMYKRAARTAMTNHTSDYDTTLLINPGLPKPRFYTGRSYMLNIIVNRLADAIDDPRFNAEVITKLHGAGIPFASFAYFDVTKREPVYAIQDKIPQEHISVPDKSSPKFYSDSENHFPYASFAAKRSTNVLNLRILRALEKPKNVTVLQLYTKTSPEIKLIEVTVPFYEYDETETQISLADQWKAADRINILDGVPVLSLPALKAEQQKLRTLKDAAEIDRRIADIDALIPPAGGAGSAFSARRRTLKLRR